MYLGDLVEFGDDRPFFTTPRDKRTRTTSPAVSAKRKKPHMADHILKRFDEDLETLMRPSPRWAA